ncbi:MAG: Sjogren's syndrome/scleroderma autoantigen 1 family protein [Candidatus Asgardarchaeia archaeon]
MDRDAVIKKMAEMLKKGGKMLGENCPRCGTPLFEIDGEKVCPSCGKITEEKVVEKREDLSVLYDKLVRKLISFLDSLSPLEDPSYNLKVIEVLSNLIIKLRMLEKGKE